MRIHWDYLCNEVISIGKRKLSIALWITLDSTRKLHLVVYRNVYFLFYQRGPREAGFERLTWAEQAKNPLFPLRYLLKKGSEADGAFPIVGTDSGYNQLLSAVLATLVLSMQTQICAEVASALCFLVVCCGMWIHWGPWNSPSFLCKNVIAH